MGYNQTSGVKLSIDDLEQQFDFLHGNGNYLRGEQFTDNLDPISQKMRKGMNSHDFKFSMIPFSQYNGSSDVNLYHPESKIPFLLKEQLSQAGAVGGVAQQQSLFFKCYQDDIYEAILEDLRAHYIAISN
jgi:hypothetical protein